MRSAPTLKIWMTPFASVAMLEKLALLKIALCSAPAVSRTSVGEAFTPMLFEPDVRRSEVALSLMVIVSIRDQALDTLERSCDLCSISVSWCGQTPSGWRACCEM